MKVLTYTSYKKHCDLYTEIHDLIAVNSCQIELPQKDIIVLSEVSIVYKAGERTGVENTKFNLSAGTYSIDDFNAKINVEKTTKIRSILHPGSYKLSLDTSPPPISWSMH